MAASGEVAGGAVVDETLRAVEVVTLRPVEVRVLVAHRLHQLSS